MTLPLASTPAHFELLRDDQLRCIDAEPRVEGRHGQDGDDDGEVADDAANASREEGSRLALLQDNRDDEGRQEEDD